MKVTNHKFVLDIRSSRLSLTASLKAAQLTSNLALMESTVKSTATRVLIQNALKLYNDQGNNTADNWNRAQADLEAALGGGQQPPLVLQSQLYPISASGPAGASSLINATSSNVMGAFKLPYSFPNGTPVYLGDGDLGFPPGLYPNLTYGARSATTLNEQTALYNGDLLDSSSALLLGPWALNSSTSLVSLTVPIINNTSATDILGWLTVVLDGRLIKAVIDSTEGLDQTGVTLLVGPANSTNHFPSGFLYNSNGVAPTLSPQVHFVLPVSQNDSSRHMSHAVGTANAPFDISTFPAVQTGLTQNQQSTNNAGSLISTHNEEGLSVSVGFAIPDTSLCDWIVVLEQEQSEVWAPINHLRNVLLACVFGTVGALLLLTLPLAHFASRPIRRLREATSKSVVAPGFTPSIASSESPNSRNGAGYGNDDEDAKDTARKEGFLGSLTRWRRGGRPNRAQREEDERRRVFRIPGKVRDRKHVIHDELTDLTQTFNEMSDELMMQYERLEERVKQRTAELELSKKAAEAANESKTLFIANISHELKTPLNGILGMCAVCMQEDDPTRLKRSLGIIYKSGDLLLNLLTDLLTFSKNQVGQQLSLDEKEFRLRDISSQVLAIFDKQSKEGQIDLEVKFQGLQETETSDLETANDITEHGPFGFGRLKDMTLWGDQHRILQVVINLVSNSLKFTGPGGKVVLSIKCLGAAPSDGGSRKTSVMSKQSRLTSVGDSKHRSKLDSDISVLPQSKYTNTANEINITDKGRAYAQIMAAERSPSPPLGRNLLFEFEVEDTGPGIAEHQQQRIFEPFVQGDLGLSKKYGGTGLGLSICSQLTGLMRGTISLKSQVGVGNSTASSRVDVGGFNSRRSSVEESRASPARPPPDDARSSRSLHSANSAPTTVAPVTFEADSQPRLVGLSQPFFASTQPLESPGSQMAAMERVAAEATKGERVRVLVAEDNKVNQEVVLRMLKLEDIYNVTVAKDGQEALDKVKESMETHKPYDLIFMDVQMPNLDGLQSTRLIREIGYSAPIVALTAFAEESNVKDCLDSGMNYFLSKPIRRPALKKVLK
ncbi:hypothetical protein LTR04_000879, partial [Oleoguttula sp. CCFEE 6159]